MSLLIKNGTVVTSDKISIADLYVEDDTITAIGESLTKQSQITIDASGKFVIPGGIDVHTHLEAPVGGTTSSDDFETGTRAAAFGGTTCIVDFATQSKGQSLLDAYRIWRQKAAKATLDYGLHMIVVDVAGSRMEELDGLVGEGVTSFKLFMAYPGVLLVDDATILQVMLRARNKGALVAVHAENGGAIEYLVQKARAEGRTAPIEHALTRPATTEAEAVHRVIELAQKADVPLYIVHVTSAGALKEIARARQKGIVVFGETCPQYLFLTKEELRRPDFEGAKFVLTPPLREHVDQEALWKGLQEGILQVVSTDHCPFFFETQKRAGLNDFTKIPNGGPSIEHRLQLLYHFGVNQGRFSVRRWVELVAANPAKLFGLYPKKGVLQVGSDADIVIWNPNQKYTISAASHHMNVDYSMYEGIAVQGNAETVISRGEIVVNHNTWSGNAGRGRYIRRTPFAVASSTVR